VDDTIEVRVGNLPSYSLFLKDASSRSFRLPKGYKFPDGMTLCNLITMWYCGDNATKTPPLMYLQNHELETNALRSKLTMMKTLMDAVKAAAIRKGLWVRNTKWTVQMTIQLFDSVKVCFDYKYKSQKKSRFNQLVWKTIYNHWYKHDQVCADLLEGIPDAMEER
jgi:hypothetical protein